MLLLAVLVLFCWLKGCPRGGMWASSMCIRRACCTRRCCSCTYNTHHNISYIQHMSTSHITTIHT